MLGSTREHFHLATVQREGQEKLFALAGWFSGSTILDTVEEWVEDSATWKGADALTVARNRFGAVAVPRELICPA